jgi:hypothetical protein
MADRSLLRQSSLVSQIVLPIVVMSIVAPRPAVGRHTAAVEAARARGAAYTQCSSNAHRILQGWIRLKQDPTTHLFSRQGQWDYHDEAADHYSSLVLMAYYVSPELIDPGGRLHRSLTSMQTLCASPSGIPTIYNLRTLTQGDLATLTHLSEWLRDGLIRVVEVLGTDNDWYRELERLTNAMLAEADRENGAGSAFQGTEAKGNMLQALARLYVMSGNEEYILAAEAIADAVLADLEQAHRDVSFRDHGCELLPGLTELLVVSTRTHREKADAYRIALRTLLDAVLEESAHPQTGLFCRSSQSKDRGRVWLQPPDTWGYVLFAYENYDRATNEQRYRKVIEKPMRWLLENRSRFSSVKNTLWPAAKSSDDWSDSYESMIVLGNRYRDIPGVFDWLDWATLQHKHRKFTDREYGPYDGGHFDGSTGRTLCLHMMLCSQGIRHAPYQDGVGIGAIETDHGLLVTVASKKPWSGRLRFDGPRTVYGTTTIDWARINEVPQWFIVQPDGAYSVTIDSQPALTLRGDSLINGLTIAVDDRTTCVIRIRTAN